MLVAAPAHGAIGFMNGSHSFRIECSEQLFERAVGKQLRPVQRYVCVPESSAWLWPVPVGGFALSALVLLNGGAEPVILLGIELFVSAAILIRLVPKLH